MLHTNHKIQAVGVLILLGFALNGCKVWVKRGAGADQLSQDQAKCREQANGAETGDEYLGCMKEHGWYHQDKSLKPLGARDGNWPKLLPSKPEMPAAIGQPAAAMPTPRSGRVPVQPVGEGTVVDSRTEYVVGSWWKIGGSPEQLEQDQDRCRAELGAPASSSGLQWTSTHGLVQCMKNRGWYGFSE